MDNIREIMKESLREYHGDKFDRTIDEMDFYRRDFKGKPCWYQTGKASNDIYKPPLYLIISIEEDKSIKINTNLLQTRCFEIENGRRYNHFTDKDFSFLEEDRPLYNKNIIIERGRNNKIKQILND